MPANFATFLIICPTSFCLGILFTNWTYDHHTLWTSLPPSSPLISQIESHYSLLLNSPSIIGQLLHSVIGVGLLGFLLKLYRPSESNLLFDGASLVLYMIGVVMYGTNIIKGLRIVESGEYGEEVGRVDTLRVMAASQTILALVLVGVLVLQSGQWYAEHKEGQEMEEFRREEEKEAKEKAEERRGKKRN